MNARTCLAAAAVVLAGCGVVGDQAAGEPALDVETETAAHEAVRQFLHAHIDGDWDRVYDAMTEDHRPNFREQWVEHRRSGPPDKCVGDAYGTPLVDVETLAVESAGRVVVQTVVWEQSNQGRVCRWSLEHDGATWRVGPPVPRRVPT